MNNLLTRLLTAVIAGAVAIAAIVFSLYGLLFFCVIVSMQYDSYYAENESSQTETLSVKIQTYCDWKTWNKESQVTLSGEMEDLVSLATSSGTL